MTTAPAFCYTVVMKPFNQLMYRAYLRDGTNVHTGEALLLACLFHARGKDEQDFAEVQRIMKDKNYEPTRDAVRAGKSGGAG